MPSIITTATNGTMNSNKGYNDNSKKSDNIETSNCLINLLPLANACGHSLGDVLAAYVCHGIGIVL